MLLPLLLLLAIIVLALPWIGGRFGGSKGAAAATVIALAGIVGLSMNAHWHWSAPHIRTEAGGYMTVLLVPVGLLILISGGISIFRQRRREKSSGR